MPEADQAIDVSFAIDREQIARNAESEVSVVARLRAAPDRETPERPPLAVVLAIDVSASMAGDPLRQVLHSALRIAALLRPGDHLGVVAFSEHGFEVAALRPVGDPMRRELAAEVKTLSVLSGTNVEAGLRAAHDMLAARAPTLRGIALLLSDGQPNKGVCHPAELAALAQAADATTATLGYGPYHDDRVLGAIADGGRGRYAFVADPQLCQLELARALGSQGDAVAEAIEVRIAGLTHTRLRWVAGPSIQHAGQEAIVRVPNLGPGATAVVAARLTVEAGRDVRRVPVADVSVSFRLPRGAPSPAVTRRLDVAVGDTSAPPRPDVVRAVLLVEAEQRRREACTMADGGRFEDAAAKLSDVEQRIRAAPGLASDAALTEALEQLVDDIELMRRRPDAAKYAAYRRGQRELDGGLRIRSAAGRALVDDAAGEVPLAELAVVGGPQKGKVFPLHAQNVLGRTLDSDIRIPDDNVSRRHACIAAAHGSFWVLDLGSTNTTVVNGRRIDKHKLANGDEIELGPWRLQYRQR